MKLELVEIISVEVDLPGDCVILDLIIPPGKFKKEDNDIDKPKLIHVRNKCLITINPQPMVIYQSLISGTSGVFAT